MTKRRSAGWRRTARLALVSASSVVVLGVSGPPALAHQGHRSCAPAAHAYVPPEEPGDMGELASTIARSGKFHAFASAFHASLCEPKP